jgi:hypothetical protein
MRLPFSLTILLLLLISVPAGFSQTNPTPPAASPAPVIVDGKVLFYIKTGLLSFTAQHRALAVAKAIKQAAGNPQIDPRTITTQDFKERTDILAGKDRILVFTDLYAIAAGLEKDRGEIAAFYARQIQKAIEDYREARRPRVLLLGGLSALITTLILAFLLFLLKVFSRKIYARIEAWRETKIKALQVQDLEVISADQAWGFLVSLIRWWRPTWP